MSISGRAVSIDRSGCLPQARALDPKAMQAADDRSRARLGGIGQADRPSRFAIQHWDMHNVASVKPRLAKSLTSRAHAVSRTWLMVSGFWKSMLRALHGVVSSPLNNPAKIGGNPTQGCPQTGAAPFGYSQSMPELAGCDGGSRVPLTPSYQGVKRDGHKMLHLINSAGTRKPRKSTLTITQFWLARACKQAIRAWSQ